jgi:hypothetical protein
MIEFKRIESLNFIKNMNNIQEKLKSAAGLAVAIEMRMRVLSQLSELIRKELKSKKYWNCKLYLIDEAIIKVFHNQLMPKEINKLKRFKKLRNALMHAQFVELMSSFDIQPTSRHISDSRRNILDAPDIKESVLSIDCNGGFEKFVRQAHEVISILDKLF